MACSSVTMLWMLLSLLLPSGGEPAPPGERRENLPAARSAIVVSQSPAQARLARELRSLNDRDALVREAARRSVLGLRPSDLPDLEAALQSLQPEDLASGAVAMTIRDALTHIYIRDGKERHLAAGNEPDPRPGLSLAFVGFLIGSAENGLAVREPIPGFVGYEVLQVGDVILTARAGGRHERIEQEQAFKNLMGALRPGEALELVVLRGGRTLRVTIELDRRVDTGTPDWHEVEAAARHAAEQAWEERIFPILQEKLAEHSRQA